MKKTLLFILCFFTFALCGQSVFINEIMPDNEDMIMDEDGDFSDWIELYNSSNIAIDLSEYSLSDDINELTKWTFPAVDVQANDFLLIFASSKNKLGTELHTNFKISSSGEALFLSKNGIILDHFPPVSLGENRTYGRLPDGSSETFELYTSSPGSSNNLNDQLNFSHPQGYYPTPFFQSVTSLVGNEIRYTVDGSAPTVNSNIFQDPILIEDKTESPNILSEIITTPPHLIPAHRERTPRGLVDKANAIRYASFSNGTQTSPIYSHTYFVYEELADKYSLPVISLITDASYFFDNETGIYVPGIYYNPNNPTLTGNYFNKGIEWERDVHITYFDNEGDIGFSQDAGIRINGGSTRNFAQKSLRLYARGNYGTPYFNYPLLPQKSLDQYENFILRGTMGPWYYNTIINDDLAHGIVSDMDMDFQDFRPVLVFLNGEYWGIHTVRDRQDDKYIEYLYGIDRDAVEFHEAWGNINFENFIAFVSDNDLSIDTNYGYVKSQFDIDNYLDYQITQMYLNNVDWPGNNVKGWRSSEFGMKWRWLFFDLDAGFRNPDYNMFVHCTNEDESIAYPNPPGSTIIFRSLLENELFKEKFISRYAELLLTEFHKDTILLKLEEIKTLYKNEMLNHVHRWNFPGSTQEWEDDISNVMVDFIQKRPCAVEKQIKEFFNLENFDFSCETEEPSLPEISIYPNPSNGILFLNNASEEFVVGDISVYNVLGQKVLFQKGMTLYPESDKELNFSYLPNNIYFVNISNDFFSETFKLEVMK